MARERTSKKIVAIKVIYQKEIKSKNLITQLKREVEIHSRLRHENVVRMEGYFYDAQAVYLVLEYAHKGELYKVLQAQGRLAESQAAKHVMEVARALRYCHSKGVIHRDIKPENLLVMEDGTVKLGDFGWAVVIEEDTRRQTLCGTLDYLPPEMVMEQEYGPEVDAWSLGVLAYELIVGYPCFETQSNEATFTKITTAELQFPSHVSQEAQSFISSLLHKDPSKRPTMNQLVVHPWLARHNTTTE